MGLDIPREVIIPEFVQDFLQEILAKTLDGGTESSIMADIRAFKEEFKQMELG